MVSILNQMLKRAIFLLVSCLSAGPVCADEFVTEQQLDSVTGADIVLLGEVHDNPRHHQIQARFIDHLRPRAVVFEMLAPAQAAAVSADMRDDPDRMGEVLKWDSSGWPPFELYKPIFSSLRDAVIIGAAVEQESVRRATKEGAFAVFGPGGRAYGLDLPLPEDEQQAQESLQFMAHCSAMPRQYLPGMVEAQRLRDAAFAQAVLDALDTYGPPIVLIAGNGHTRTDWGVPKLLRTARPDVTVKSVGLIESTSEDAPFDLAIIAEAVEEIDRCANFKPRK